MTANATYTPASAEAFTSCTSTTNGRLCSTCPRSSKDQRGLNQLPIKARPLQNCCSTARLKMNDKRFVTLAMLALFVFLFCSSGNVRAVTWQVPPWDANISNLVKHADLVVLGKVIGMKGILSERSTLISLKVESVIKGDKAVGDRRLGFTVWGDAGIKTYRNTHTVSEFSLNERVLVFLKGLMAIMISFLGPQENISEG